jgi:hypothetical protein
MRCFVRHVLIVELILLVGVACCAQTSPLFLLAQNIQEHFPGRVVAGPARETGLPVDASVANHPVNSAIAALRGHHTTDIAVVDFRGALGLALPAKPAVAVPGFLAPVDVTVAGHPSAVTAWNTGEDSTTQGIAVANQDTDNVSVISDVTVGAVTFSVGSAPASIVAGNFSGGGFHDLATANSGDNTVSVLLFAGTDPDGNPTFSQAASYPVGKSPVSIATGDVNGDGALDLVVANSTDNSVSVLLGDVAAVGKGKPAGAGTFGAALSVPVGKSPRAVAVTDLNGDGNQDIVTVNFADNTVSVLLAQVSNIGGGQGFGFAQAVPYPVGHGPVALAIADFNNDFILDLAVLNSTDGTVSILLGKGDGTFAAQQVIQVPAANGSLVAQDFDGDTNADLIITDPAGQQILFLQGNGDGTFNSAVGTTLQHTPQAIAVGDFSGDGIADVVVADLDATDVTVVVNATTSVAAPACGSSGLINAPVIGTQLTANVLCRGAFIQGSPNQQLLVIWDTNPNSTLPPAGTGPGGGTNCGITGNLCNFSPSICLPTGGYSPGGFTLNISGSTAASQGIDQSQDHSAIAAVTFAVSPATATVPTNGTFTFNTPEPNACMSWSLSAPELSITPDLATGKTDATYVAPASVPVPNTVTVLAAYNDATQSQQTQATPATVTIIPTNAAPAFTSGASVTFQTGVASSFTVTTTGSPTPTITESGALPAGIKFVDNGDGTATLSGTPTQLTASSFPLVFTAQNGVAPNATQNFTLNVSSTNSSPEITSANQAIFEIGAQNSFAVTTTGKPAPSITESGALPSGVNFKDNGNGTATLSGTPAAASGGIYAITFTATNGIAPDATQSFTLDVPTITLTYPAFPSPAATLAGGGTIQFTAVVTGLQNVGVVFTVSGTGCAGGACGTITQAGLYTPPATFTGSSAIVDTVSVASLGDEALPVLSFPVTVYPPAVVPQQPPPVSLTAGQTASSSLSVTGNTGSVEFSFACVPTQFAQGAQCTVSPSGGALSSTPLNLSVTIQTTSQIASAVPPGGRNSRLFLAMFAPLVGVVLAGVRWNRPRLWLTAAGILLILGALGFVMACGTNGTFGALPPPPPPNATPSGVYQLVIVAAPPGVDPQSSGASAIGAITVTVTNTPH